MGRLIDETLLQETLAKIPMEMRMTIDEVNERLFDIKTDAIYQITSEEKEAINIAIETMRKYQKIEQMLYEYKDMIHAPCLMKGHKCAVYEILNEVIEDGTD